MRQPAKPRTSMSFNVDQLKSLDELLAILVRGGDATVVARRSAIAEVLTLVRAARRRVESGLTLAREQRSMPAETTRATGALTLVADVEEPCQSA